MAQALPATRLQRFTVPVVGAATQARVPLILLILHAALGAASVPLPALASVHAMTVCLTVVGVSLASRRVDRILSICFYAALCDVFWRITKAAVPWEVSKYLVMFAMAAIVVRFVRHPKRIGIPVTYLLALMPSCVITIAALGIGAARDSISGDLAGPVALGFAVLCCRQLIARHTDMQTLLWTMLCPIISVATLVTIKTAQAGNIRFQQESNFQTSGGFGPNQVSTILGLGALLCLFIGLGDRRVRSLAIAIGLGAWCAGTGILTFSRGGFYALAIAGLAMLLVGLVSSGVRSKAVLAAVIVPIVLLALFSQLDTFTDGSLSERFDDTGTSERTEIAMAEVNLFFDNPIFGIGPGMAEYERSLVIYSNAGAHTEYSRALAEHGIFGLLALICVASFAVSGLRHSQTRWNRLIAVGAIVWPLVTMAHGATRTAAVAVLFGLSQLRIDSDEKTYQLFRVHDPTTFQLRRRKQETKVADRPVLPDNPALAHLTARPGAPSTAPDPSTN